MRVAVILPAFNAEKWIADALASVAAQDPSPDQVIVVDDGSTDRTAEIAIGSGIQGLKVIQQDQAGPAAARNTALRNLDCEWVGFIDADDLWSQNKLACQLSLARANPDTDIWLGATEGVALEDLKHFDSVIPAEFSSRPFFQLGAALIRKELFDRIGLFDTSLQFGEDVDWGIRAKQHGARIEVHPETVQTYRRHSSNMTNDAEACRTDFMRVLKKSIDRRRAAEG